MKLSAIPEEKLQALSIEEKTRIVFGGVRNSAEPAIAALLLGCASPQEMAERSETAASLYKEGLVPSIIPSGGVVHATELGDMSEAEYMAHRLRALGVPDEAVILETQATTTIENMVFGTEVLERSFHPHGPFSVYVVTSAPHLRRSLALAGVYLPRTARILGRAAGSADGQTADWFRSAFWTGRVERELKWLKRYIDSGLIPDIEF